MAACLALRGGAAAARDAGGAAARCGRGPRRRARNTDSTAALTEANETGEGADIVSGGLALRLLDAAGAAPVPSPRAAINRRDRQGRAAITLRDHEEAVRQLRAVAARRPAGALIGEWLGLASAVADARPGHAAELRRLARQVISAGNAGELLFWAGDFGLGEFETAAADILRGATPGWNREGGWYGATQYLASLRSWDVAMNAYCGSAAGSAKVASAGGGVPGAATGGDRDYAWETFSTEIPQARAAAFVRARLTRDPEAINSACIAGLFGSLDSRPLVREAAGAAVRSRPDLLRKLEALSSGRRHDDRVTPACETFADRFRIGAPAQDEVAGGMLSYSIACQQYRADERITAGLAIPIQHQVAVPDIVRHAPVAAPYAVWAGRYRFPAAAASDDTVRFPFERSEVLTALLAGGFDRDLLDYSALVTPLMVGRSAVNAAEENERQAGAARLLLIAGDDPQLAGWIVARLSDYRRRDAADVPNALATLRRAWDHVNSAIERRRLAERRIGVADARQRRWLDQHWADLRRRIADEAAVVVERSCAARGRPAGDRPFLSRIGLAAGVSCIDSGSADAAALIAGMRDKGLTSAASAIEAQLDREGGGGFLYPLILALLLHVAAWTLLLIVYPVSPVVQASVFWNPWVRKYLGLGYVQLLLLVVPAFTRRLLMPFRPGLTADGQLENFRRDVYYDRIGGCRHKAGGPATGKLGELVPSLDGKLWLEAKSGLGKSWFLRDLANSHAPAADLPQRDLLRRGRDGGAEGAHRRVGRGIRSARPAHLQRPGRGDRQRPQ